MPPFRSVSKPSSMKSCSRHQLTYLTIFLLILYLIFAINRLQSDNCPPLISAQHLENASVLSLPPPITSFQARHSRPLPSCARGRARSFLMVFMGHSGSSALVTELKQHPLIQIESNEMVDHQSTFNTTEALAITRAYFKRVIATGKVPAFKIRPTHILNDPEAWKKLLAEFNTRIIWNYRKNIFKQVVGEYSHRYLNDTSAVEGLRVNLTAKERCRIGAGCRFPITNFNFFHSTLRGITRSQHSIYRAIGHLSTDQAACVREVPYEDYLYHRQQVLHDLFSFLGLPFVQTTPDRFKATDDNLCHVVENWPQLCRKFYGCILLQHMMDDERNSCYCPLSVGNTEYCKLD